MPSDPLFVFVHGFLGFVRFPLFPAVAYFRGVEAALSRRGVRCLFPAVPKAGSVAQRATVLAAALAGTGDGPLVLIGHSMGGLDARYYAGKLDNARRVRAVVTVATPHRGTPVAEWALAGQLPFPFSLVRRFRAALEDLTPAVCADRNEGLADRDDVLTLAYPAARPPQLMRWPLSGFARRIAPDHGDNDGLVSVASARWGEPLAPLAADHMEPIGWNLGPWMASDRAPFDSR